MAHGEKPVTATLMLSHTHWDHIQGFPFFVPLFIPGNRFTVCGPAGTNSSLPEVLAGQMEYTYFPVELAQLGAGISWRDLSEGTHEIEGFRINAQLLNHPATALGYRIEADGVSLAYLCDHEPYWEPLWRSGAEPGKMESILHDGDRRHAEFMRGADVVIHDSQYTPQEYPAKKNWGHSTWSYVSGIAAAAGVKRLYLTHHDPAHDDAFLDGIESSARDLAASLGSRIEIFCAREGFEASFQGEKHAGTSASLAESDHSSPLLVLVVDDDEDLRLLARRALMRGGHTVIEAEDGVRALVLIASRRPDLVVLDLHMPVMDGFEVLRKLGSGRPPVIVLTAHDDEASAQESFSLGATDFLAKPFTPPQLDARVRACFAHRVR
jgi:CheY-like chemotaxis protein